MSRVNVETRALAENRFFDFAELLKLERWQAIGLLVYFWHDSQERKVWRGTREQLQKFIPVKLSDRSKVFDALLECEYVAKSGESDLFAIKGNRKHVEAMTSLLEARAKAGAKGGKRSSELRSKTKELGPSKTQATSEANGKQVLEFACSNAMQGNAEQSIAEQSDSTQSNALQKNKEAVGSDGPPPTRAASSPRGPIDDFKGDELVEQYLNEVTKETQKAWLKVYPGAQWIGEEIKRAHIWMTTNPQKKSKNFARFMSNWLSRSFESYRKGLPSRRLTNSEVNAQAALDLYKRIEDGTA